MRQYRLSLDSVAVICKKTAAPPRECSRKSGSFCAGRRTMEALYVDESTSLVISGCLCVVAASLVMLVILRLYKTLSTCRNDARRRAVFVPAADGSAAGPGCWNSSADCSSSPTRLTKAWSEHDQRRAMLPPDNLAADSRQRSETGLEE